ncbi:MAG: DUF2256 domain-containing protein [Cypionkella sp.]|uniref:DUF2256 domain-containing protein n=1 Tax=Cypionkella sp. TaxID=2811411 RepID=UPI002AB91BB8|nr:DUF2256 domain-containing protein [Cypionkella sp.]MDZ4309952.1 DUF2256 domain-containing protein [Cypionkella sp.]
MRKKADLPVKTCAACGRLMVWRKAWEKVWNEVKYCSDACRKGKGKGGRSAAPRSDQAAPTALASLLKV